MVARVTAFLDTMIYLHYKGVEEVDWRDVLGAAQVTVIVPRITTRELDKHKDHHDSRKIRERARRRLQAVEKWAEAGITRLREGVEAQVYRRPPTCDFDALQLERDRADDVLIATIHQYREENPGAAVLLVTQDTTARLTARDLGIQAIGLPEELKLAEELDPVEEEVRELRRQLNRIQNAAPKLLFGFSGEDDPESFFKVKLAKPESEEDWIASQLDALRRKYPPRQPGKPSSTTLASLMAGRAPQEEYDRYNIDLLRFYEEYEEYLLEASGEMLMQRLSVELGFELRNDGSSPAEEIDFHLHFPDGFLLKRYSEGMFEHHTPPRPPRSPRSQMEIIKDGMLSPNKFYRSPTIPDIISTFDRHPPNLSAPDIEPGDSYDVRWEMRLLKHKQSIQLHPLVAVFNSYEEADSFGIEYRIHAANVLDPIEGELHVVVEKE